ncbi:WXG100 family type VII secretion target [Nocardia sp. NPDC051750]|uniref:WXG100 family type VII secretion target n=1 Tax=Nocardia sp. NPDC051750 TaxID=3364325 RepID=UPI00379B5B56
MTVFSRTGQEVARGEVSRTLEAMVDQGGNPNPAGVVVVPEEVRAVGRFVADIAGSIRSGLDSASTDVDALLADGWTGDLSDEFFGGWTELRDGGKKILQALDGMAEQLGVQSDAYEATDRDTSQQFPSLNL